MANKNNVIAKVLGVLQNHVDGDTVLLIDQHMDSALATACKMIADTKPVGHEKAIITQTVDYSPANTTPDDFLDTPMINISPLPELIMGVTHTETLVVVDRENILSGFYYRGENLINGYPAYYFNQDDAVGNTLATSLDNCIYFDDASLGAFKNGVKYFYTSDPEDPTGDYIPEQIDDNPFYTDEGYLRVSYLETTVYGKAVNSKFALNLASSHRQLYYFLENDKMFLGFPQSFLPPYSTTNTLTFRYYGYLTIEQFPWELEDILVSELVRLIQNEPIKQQTEDKNGL